MTVGMLNIEIMGMMLERSAVVELSKRTQVFSLSPIHEVKVMHA